MASLVAIAIILLLTVALVMGVVDARVQELLSSDDRGLDKFDEEQIIQELLDEIT